MTVPQLMYIARLGDRVLEVLPRGAPATAWFSEPNINLSGAAPSDLLVGEWSATGEEARACMAAANALCGLAGVA